MKAVIDGKEVDVKTVENLGFQGGFMSRAVMYDGKEYIVQKIAGVWKQRPSDMKISILYK